MQAPSLFIIQVRSLISPLLNTMKLVSGVKVLLKDPNDIAENQAKGHLAPDVLFK